MTRASACGSSWLSVESRRVALATIATPSRADAPRRRPVAAVRHATAAEASATHWAGRQKARAALASATRLMSESDRASFAAYDVEFVVEISRCRAPLHRSTTQAHRHAADVELYSSTALYISTALQRSTLYIVYTLPQQNACCFPPSQMRIRVRICAAYHAHNALVRILSFACPAHVDHPCVSDHKEGTSFWRSTRLRWHHLEHLST